MSGLTKAAKVGEIPSGLGKKVEINGRDIALFNIDGQFFAIDDMCPHRGGSLSEGSCDDKVVACPWHGWQFDVTNGSCLTSPSAQQQTYEVKVEGNDILIGVPLNR